MRASELINRLLGVPSETQRAGNEADDRSTGYPLRRFAEFGILPGYEFPTEPASLRLLGDSHEDEPVTVMREIRHRAVSARCDGLRAVAALESDRAG